MGLWKGKKGSSVFYRIKNSNNAQKQGVRERVYDPSNPKTSAQAGQRMKMSPAQRVFSALEDVIKRAWEGVPSGMVRQEYMKFALSSSTVLWPAVEKNDNSLIPGQYLVSKGSLPEITCVDNGQVIEVGIPSEESINNDTSIGDFSELFVNAGYANGMQVTFVIFDMLGDDPSTIAAHAASFIIDTENADEYVGDYLSPYLSFSTTEGMIAFTSGIGSRDVVAGAVIVSSDAPTPKRSNARIRVILEKLDGYYNTGAKSRARKSYMAPEITTRRDWEVQPVDGGANTIATVYTISGLTNPQQSIFNGVDVLVYADTDTNQMVAVGTRNGSGYVVATQNVVEGPCVCDSAGNLITRDYTVQGETFLRNLLVSEVAALAELRQVPQQ